MNINPAKDFVLEQQGHQVAEVDGYGTGRAWQHSNVFANGELLATYDANGTHFAFGDWLGAKRLQVTVTTAGVSVDESCWNLPFNDSFGCSGSVADATEHHYNGHLRDNNTGLDLFGARNYTNYSGRFLSPDWSAKPEDVPYSDLNNPQSLNLYAYAGNNPLSRADPDGHKTPLNLWGGGWGSSGGELLTGEMIGSLQDAMEADLAASEAQQQNTITASAKGTSVTYTYPDGSKIVLTGTHPFRDNNPGDLRSGHGSIGRDGGFAIYPTLDAGVNALGATLTGKYADSTIGDTMKAFAPAADGNDSVKYANTLATAVGVPVTTKISALTSAQLMTFQYNIAVAEGYNAAGNTARYIAPPQ